MLAGFGQISLSVSLLLFFTCLVTGILAGKRGDARLETWLPRLYSAACFGVLLSSALLVSALLIGDFSLRYVWMYSNRTLEPIYRFTAFWGGQEGSLLFWCLIMALCSLSCVFWIGKQPHEASRRRTPYVIAVFSAILLFFHMVMYFAENPFATLTTPQADGRGLNPLLQTWSMIVHPPALYVGFILCSVPFAIAVATLLRGGGGQQLDSRWIRETRVWTLLAWFFLTLGNILGANWAYMELGWGGFWAWDPVENAAIMPWFTTTAYLHSLMVQERRGMLKTWNFVLLALSFCLTILGTFLTRSGLVSSVHTFAQSNLGYFFLAFLIICIGFSAFVIWRCRDELRNEGQIDSLWSREAAFVANNILLSICCFAIFWGTLFPIFSEAFTGNKITVGAPYFNSFMVPLGLALLALMGYGQTIAWRKTAVERLGKMFNLPLLAGGSAALATLIWQKDFSLTGWYVVLSFGLSLFVLASIAQEYARGMRARRRSHGENWLTALVNLTLAARRRFGGYIVHFGILLVFFGITGTAFKQEREVTLQRGEAITAGPYKLIYRGLRTQADEHKEAVYALLHVSSADGNFVLEPARFFYRTGNEKSGNSGAPQTSTEVALRSGPLRDLYSVLHTFDLQTGSATLMITVNPLVWWLWIGGWVMALGTLIVLLPRRWENTVLQVIREIDYDHQTGKMTGEDHQTLRETLLDQAARLQHAHTQNLEDLRQQIAALPQPRLEDWQFCTACGLPQAKAAHYCGDCGAALAKNEAGK